MHKSYKGHKFILYITDEVTNYFITVPIYHSRSEEIGDALMENVISKYCIPDYDLTLSNGLVKLWTMSLCHVLPVMTSDYKVSLS